MNKLDMQIFNLNVEYLKSMSIIKDVRQLVKELMDPEITGEDQDRIYKMIMDITSH